MSFDEFVAFLFDHDIDHDIPSESEKYDPWYFHVEVKFDANNIGAYYARMFEQPEFLLTRFTKAQLEEGFWAIQGPNLNCSFSRIIEDSTYPYPSRGMHSFHGRFVQTPFRYGTIRYFGSDVVGLIVLRLALWE